MAKKAQDPAESKAPVKTEPAPAVLKERAKWMSKLQDLGFAADCTQDAYRDSIQTPSPQFNFALGCGSRTGRHGIPRGFSALFGGHPKGGKTAAIYATIGQLHQDDPEAFVIRFDTELKESAAMTPDQLRMWGIDPTRYICYETNSPDEIFDRIRYGIAEMVEAGLPLALVVIDSVNEISGKRAAIAEAGVGSGKKPSILNWSLGDHAAILQEGFKVILPFLRRNRVACILTCHVGAEFDEQAKMLEEHLHDLVWHRTNVGTSSYRFDYVHRMSNRGDQNFALIAIFVNHLHRFGDGFHPVRRNVVDPTNKVADECSPNFCGEECLADRENEGDIRSDSFLRQGLYELDARFDHRDLDDDLGVPGMDL